VGTHFGGSLYSFRRPGRTAVTATFHVPEAEIEAIRREVDEAGKAEPVFTAEVVDEDRQVVAEVEKRLHVSKKTG
jgi:hypothetical protein